LLEIRFLERYPAVVENVGTGNTDNVRLGGRGNGYIVASVLIGIEKARVRVSREICLLPRRNLGVFIQDFFATSEKVAAVHGLAGEDCVLV